MAKPKKRGVHKVHKLPKLSVPKAAAAKEGSDVMFWIIVAIVVAALVWLLVRSY